MVAHFYFYFVVASLKMGDFETLCHLIFELLQALRCHVSHQGESHRGGPGGPGVVRRAHNHLESGVKLIFEKENLELSTQLELAPHS